MRQLDLFATNDGVSREADAPAPLAVATGNGLPVDVDHRTEENETVLSSVLLRAPTTSYPAAGSHGRRWRPAPTANVASFAPLAMRWEDALTYTSLSPSELRRAERSGALTFRRVGARGARVASRAQLDRLVEQIFGSVPKPVEEDFDFG